MSAKEQLKAAVAAKTTDQLKAAAQLLISDFSNGAGVAFAFVLNELEARMNPADYATFCDSL